MVSVNNGGPSYEAALAAMRQQHEAQVLETQVPSWVERIQERTRTDAASEAETAPSRERDRPDPLTHRDTRKTIADLFRDGFSLVVRNPLEELLRNRDSGRQVVTQSRGPGDPGARDPDRSAAEGHPRTKPFVATAAVASPFLHDRHFEAGVNYLEQRRHVAGLRLPSASVGLRLRGQLPTATSSAPRFVASSGPAVREDTVANYQPPRASAYDASIARFAQGARVEAGVARAPANPEWDRTRTQIRVG